MPLPNDVAIPGGLPGFGDAYRNENPQVGLMDYAQRLPPRLRQLLMSIFPQIFNQYLNTASHTMDTPRQTIPFAQNQPGVVGSWITNPTQAERGPMQQIPRWTDWLDQSNPMDMLRNFLPRAQRQGPMSMQATRRTPFGY